MTISLSNGIMRDGSRLFFSLPATVDYPRLRTITAGLPGAHIHRYMEGLIDVWLVFSYRGEEFLVKDDYGEYWFFVTNGSASEDLLTDVASHFSRFIPPPPTKVSKPYSTWQLGLAAVVALVVALPPWNFGNVATSISLRLGAAVLTFAATLWLTRRWTM